MIDIEYLKDRSLIMIDIEFLKDRIDLIDKKMEDDMKKTTNFNRNSFKKINETLEVTKEPLQHKCRICLEDGEYIRSVFDGYKEDFRAKTHVEYFCET